MAGTVRGGGSGFLMGSTLEFELSPNSEAEWRQASVPGVEGGILAARNERRNAADGRSFSVRRFARAVASAGLGSHGSTAGKDASRYGPASEFGLNTPCSADVEAA